MGTRMTIEEIDNGNRRCVEFKKFYGYVPYESVRKSFNYLVDNGFFKQTNELVNGDVSMGYQEYKHLYEFVTETCAFECEMNMSNEELSKFLSLYKMDWARCVLKKFEEDPYYDFPCPEMCTEEAWSCLIDLEDRLVLKDILNSNNMKEVYWS